MIYPIVVYGDPVLRQKAKDIKEGTDLTQLITDMHETMQAAHGIGLAAPQIGKSIRLFIVDATSFDKEDEEDEDMSDFKKAFINPQIASRIFVKIFLVLKQCAFVTMMKTGSCMRRTTMV